ncbi:MAG: hypothetical protein E4G96_03390 [Chrysiogenales bacterium]|nr:MAG: hypothetical protein E4G96_03390 [Chrysiogenales bacterium]
MKKPEGEYRPGAYLPGMIAQADEKRDRLMDILNGLTRLAYEKGTRKGDIDLRKGVESLVGEAEGYYRAVRLFASGKAGDREAFREILVFFHERCFGTNALKEAVAWLKRELADQERHDREHNARHADEGYVRKTNLYAKRLETDLSEWEKAMTLHAEPLLFRFLTDVNDIVLYNRIDERMTRLMTNEDVFALSGAHFLEFKESIAYNVRTHICINRSRMTESEIDAVIQRVLQQMGFRYIILRARNINEERLNGIIGEIIREGKMVEFGEGFSASRRGAADAIRFIEKKERTATDTERILPLLEGLCFLEDEGSGAISAADAQGEGIAKMEKERYPFHSPGTFDASLKFVAEHMRNTLIFILDWLNREMKKTPENIMYLRVLFECLPTAESFMKSYGSALAIAARKSNQGASTFGTRDVQYITKAMARELTGQISELCDIFSHALIDASYNAAIAGTDRSKALSKKIEVIKDNCGDARVKISKGLSEMRKP